MSSSSKRDSGNAAYRRRRQSRSSDSPAISPKTLPQAPQTNGESSILPSSRRSSAFGNRPDKHTSMHKRVLSEQTLGPPTILIEDQPTSPLTSQAPGSDKFAESSSSTSQSQDTADSGRVEDALRISLYRDADDDLLTVSSPKSSCSSNSRLQRILAEKDMDKIDTSSAPSTTYSSAKSTGFSVAMSSASSVGDFSSRPLLETAHRMSLVLPAIPSDDECHPHHKKNTPGSTDSQSQPRSSLAEQDLAILEQWAPVRYVPGPIKIDRTFGLYAIPIMTAMDVLCSSEGVSDEQGVDDMIDYFAAFGLDSLANTMDMFWKTVDITLPSAVPITPSTLSQVSSQSKRASRHSPINSKSDGSSMPSPDKSNRSHNSRGSMPSPTTQQGNTVRLSAGQQSLGSLGHQTSAKEFQHSSVRAKSSPQISPQWVLDHRDPNATAYLAVPSGTPVAIQQAILSKPPRRVSNRPKTQQFVSSRQEEDLLHPSDSDGNSRRRARVSDESSRQRQSSKGRFSLRRMLSRSQGERL